MSDPPHISLLEESFLRFVTVRTCPPLVRASPYRLYLEVPATRARETATVRTVVASRLRLSRHLQRAVAGGPARASTGQLAKLVR